MTGTSVGSSDEDEQRAKLWHQQAKNEQLFVIVRKKCPQEQIINEIKQCLDSGAEINCVNTRGKTILDIARQKKCMDLVTFILERGGQAKFTSEFSSNEDTFVPLLTEVRKHEIQPANTVSVTENGELKAFLLADSKRYLTEDKLKKLNLILQSGLETQTITNLLMECRIDMNYKDPGTNAIAIDIAWEHGYYDSMLMLLEADSKFPQAFAIDVLYDGSHIPEKLKAFVRKRQQLHYWIQSNKLEEIKNYISNHQLSMYFSSDNKSALEIAAEHANAEIIACLCTLQFQLQVTTITETQRNMFRQLDTQGNTLLSIAARSGKSDNVDFLKTCGIDINHRNRYNQRAIDLAWANKRYNVVLLLLKADSDFPKSFYLDRLNEENDQKALKLFVAERNKLHKLIEENQLEVIKNVATCDKSKLFSNSYGQSALFTAIRTKRFEIYAFLKSIGLAFKNEDEEEYIENLQLDEKDTLKTAMIREFPQVDKGHILYLISKSRSQKPVNSFKEFTEKLYKYLDDIPEISIILQVMQYTDYLDIVFDFENENITHINPTASSATRGTTDYKDGRIYIAAKADEKQLSGTLAHELTHLAMYMIYKNDCNPFVKGENKECQAFAVITALIHRSLFNVIATMNGNENDPIVVLATSFKYPRNEHQSELIARVPHVLAQYAHIGKHFLNTKFRLLYDYYNDICQRCREFIKNSFLIKPRNNMQLLNETLGEINDIIKYEIYFKEPIELNSFLKSKKQVLLVETESTFLSILGTYESLIIKNKNYSIQDSLFLEFNSYKEKEDEVIQLFYSPIGKILCLRFSTDLNKETLFNVLKTFKVLLSLKCDKKIILIINESDKNICHTITGMFKDNYTQVMDHRFTLNNFTEDCQKMLLERPIAFLGENIQLHNFIDLSDNNAKEVIDTTTLMNLIKCQIINIGCKPQDTSFLEGAYSELFEEVDLETFIYKLISQDSKDAYVITGITGLDKDVSLLNCLNIKKDDSGEMSIVEKLKNRILLLKQFVGRNIFNQNILIADELFEEKDFQDLCHNNPAGKIYWIHLKHEVKPQFLLQKIYNPDFYITGKRFNHEVVIERNIVQEFCSATLPDTFVIEVKHESEIMKWFQFRSEQKAQFEDNYKSRKIRFVASLRSWKEYFQSDTAGLENQAVHLLMFKQDHLIWSETFGSVNILLKYRAKDYKNIYPLMDENDVIKTIIHTRVTILAGDPGTGKSTSLNQLCNAKYMSQSGKAESINQSNWVIKINLKDHLQAIRKMNFTNSDMDDKLVLSEVVDFLIQADKKLCGNSTKSFVKGLLSIMLRNNNLEKAIFIVFDGFDEILDEKNRIKIISLLQHLKDKTYAKLCITTRLHFENDLEAALSIFAMRLEPMDHVSVLNLVKEHFSSRFKLLKNQKKFLEIFDDDYNGISTFADAFLIKIQEVFKGDVTKFIGTPLQLLLMLEVSSGYFQKIIQGKVYLESHSPDFSYFGHDIWEIYENFINRKYEIVCNKTGHKEVTQLQEDKENFDNYHMDLAKVFLNVKSSVRESFNKFQDIVLSVGIIKSDGGNLDFIHSTFAEFFAAKAFLYWINKWQKKNDSVRKNLHKQQYFCSKILCGLNYRVIRSFLNAKFLKEKLKNVQFREKYYTENILFVSAMENHVGIAEFVFTNFSNVDINARDCNNHTVLYTAATFVSPEMIKWLVKKGADKNAKDENCRTVMHIIAKHGTLEIIKWLAERGADLNEKDKYGRSILIEAAAFGRLEIIKWLLETGADINSKDENYLNILHEVAAFGSVEIVNYLIDKGADLNSVDKYGTTILHVAATYGSLDIIKLLIDKGADINAEDKYGRTALHEAAASGSLEIVEYLVDMNADFNAETKDGKRVLYMAVASNYLKIVVYLVNKGIDLNDEDMHGRTVLHEAVKYGHFEIVQWLVEKGADVNAKDENSRKILHEAAASGNIDIINYLVDHGAVLNVEDKDGKKLLHEAASCGCFETVKWLVQKGAAVNAEDKNGWTILHEAVEFGSFEIVTLLVEEGADINACDKDEKTVLHVAAERRHIDIVEWLVRNMVNIDAKDKYGRTVLHYAIGVVENLGMVEWLGENGADINAKDKDDSTVLHYALAKFGNLEAISWLVENGADINAKDKDDRTVLHYALSEFGNLDTVQYLVQKGANISATDKNDATILHYAVAKFGNLDIVKWLVEKGADINATDENHHTILFYAVAEIGNLETIKWLIDKDVDVNAYDKFGETVLHHIVNTILHVSTSCHS